MKVFGRYFLYRTKQTALRTTILSVLSAVICLLTVESCTKYDVSVYDNYINYNDSGIYILATVLGVFCTLIPILELSGFKNRRNLDTLYFFPIKRSKMALVHYLSGALQIFIIYTVSFLASWIYLSVRTDYFALEYMPLYYLFSLILGGVLYSVFMFIFGEANSVADGVLFCGLWIFLLYLVMWVVRSEFLSQYIVNTKLWEDSSSIPAWGIVYAPLNNLTVIFQDLIEVNKKLLQYDYTSVHAARYMSQMYMFFIWIGLGVAAAVGYFLRFAKKGAHMAGELSGSPFGYKMLIPVYGYLLILASRTADAMMIVVILALMLIGYIIYRRSFRIKKGDIIIIACSLLPALLMNMAD